MTEIASKQAVPVCSLVARMMTKWGIFLGETTGMVVKVSARGFVGARN